MIGPQADKVQTQLVVGANSNPYPTIANSLIWIDFGNGCTDDSGVTLATAGQSVQTIKLYPGWGASLGDGLVRQATSGNRPTWQTNGLQCNGTSTIMSLPATISLNSVFTAYAVVDFNGAYNQPVTAFAGTTGSFGGVIINYNASGMRAFDDSATYIQTLATSPSGMVLARIRRQADTGIYFAQTGVADAAKSSTAYTWAINRILSYPSVFTNSSARVRHMLLFSADTVTAGTDAAIQAAIIARTPGLTGITATASTYGFFRQYFGNYFRNYFGGNRS